MKLTLPKKFSYVSLSASPADRSELRIPNDYTIPISASQPPLFFNNKHQDTHWKGTAKQGPLTLKEIMEKRYSDTYIYIIIPVPPAISTGVVKSPSTGWQLLLGLESAGLHSELAAGFPVFAAGEVTFRKGVIVAITTEGKKKFGVNNKSGHYRPSGQFAREYAISAFGISADWYWEI